MLISLDREELNVAIATCKITLNSVDLCEECKKDIENLVKKLEDRYCGDFEMEEQDIAKQNELDRVDSLLQK